MHMNLKKKSNIENLNPTTRTIYNLRQAAWADDRTGLTKNFIE
jgi:hypothetical protein